MISNLKKTARIVGIVMLYICPTALLALMPGCGETTQHGYNILFETWLEGSQEHRIYLIKDDGSELRFLAVGVEASLSPDGKLLAYNPPTPGPVPPGINKINLVNLESGEPTTNDNLNGTSPAWSPDGNRLAFIAPDGHFCITDKDGNNPERLDVGGSAFSWSPDGRKIAYSTGQLFVVNADGSDNKLVSKSLAAEPSVFDFRVEWSPDSSKLAFSSGIHTMGPFKIYVAYVDGDGQIELIQNGVHGAGYSWSPDGSKLAFTSMTSNVPSISSSDLYVVNADGSNLTLLSHDEGISTEPYWSPDGKKIVYSHSTSTGPGNSNLDVIGSDGSNRTRLTAVPGVCQGAWYAPEVPPLHGR